MVQTSRGDTEALVVGITNDFLIAKLYILLFFIYYSYHTFSPDNTEFQLPLQQDNITNEQKVLKGDVITFSYDHINLVVPQNPKLVRVRGDITWKDIIKTTSKDLNGNHNPQFNTCLLINISCIVASNRRRISQSTPAPQRKKERNGIGKENFEAICHLPES